MLTPEDLKVITEILAPKVRSGEVSLLLGAGFAIGNPSIFGEIPGSGDLMGAILAKCGRIPGPKTSLKDAYVLGERTIDDFPGFLKSIFTVESVPAWRQRIFSYAWRRIFTTNIDNVLQVAHAQQRSLGRLGGDFKFLNYTDPGVGSDSIGSIPVVSIHGTCSRLSDGFVFSNVEYALVTSKVHDWHRDLASTSLVGGLLVVGNQLDESDLDAYIAAREDVYGAVTTDVGRNWLVVKDPDPIKLENYIASGYHVFDATAEEFFDALYAAAEPRSVGEIVLESVPSVANAARNQTAMTWFKSAMEPAVTAIERAQTEKGILRHYITGDEPDWFYIVNGAHAETSRDLGLARKIGDILAAGDTGIGVLHVVGPSGSGKTTAIRAAVHRVIGSNPYIYEFRNGGAIELDLLRATISKFTEKSIFIFYSASEFYYAVSYIYDHFKGKNNPFCLFILEDRASDYSRNRAQLNRASKSDVFQITEVNIDDAKAIAQKMDAHGLVVDNFSELPLSSRARLIVDKERGYSGDLLSALFSLTTHENFEEKIYQDYFSVKGDRAREALESVVIINSLGFNVPINYVAGFLDLTLAAFQEILATDLAGIVVYLPDRGAVRCRHRVIATYYLEKCISKHGSSELLMKMFSFLSRQFTVADIKHHPLPYRIYKELITFEFLYECYFANESRMSSTEAVYHECQKFFGTDGLFWLHFGRFYRKTDHLDEAIECFRTGLTYYQAYQTRHQLGLALLERYEASGYRDGDDYIEGIDILDRELAERGSVDAFPIGTLLQWLKRITKNDPGNEDAKKRLTKCANFAMRHFRDDPFVREQLAGIFPSRIG